MVLQQSDYGPGRNGWNRWRGHGDSGSSWREHDRDGGNCGCNFSDRNHYDCAEQHDHWNDWDTEWHEHLAYYKHDGTDGHHDPKHEYWNDYRTDWNQHERDHGCCGAIDNWHNGFDDWYHRIANWNDRSHVPGRDHNHTGNHDHHTGYEHHDNESIEYYDESL